MHNISFFFLIYRNKAVAPSSFCCDDSINLGSSTSFDPWAEIARLWAALEVDGIMEIIGSGFLGMLIFCWTSSASWLISDLVTFFLTTDGTIWSPLFIFLVEEEAIGRSGDKITTEESADEISDRPVNQLE